MAPTVVEAGMNGAQQVIDRVRHAAGQMTEATAEFRRCSEAVSQVVEDGMHAATRAARLARRRAEHLGDEATHQIRRRPLAAIGMAVGAGVMFGVAAGWLIGRLAVRRS